jgi:hypothetical protein
MGALVVLELVLTALEWHKGIATGQAGLVQAAKAQAKQQDCEQGPDKLKHSASEGEESRILKQAEEESAAEPGDMEAIIPMMRSAE